MLGQFGVRVVSRSRAGIWGNTFRLQPAPEECILSKNPRHSPSPNSFLFSGYRCYFSGSKATGSWSWL